MTTKNAARKTTRTAKNAAARKAAALAAVKTYAAKKLLLITTLKTRNSDALDFHDTPVWAMEAAIEAAFEAGVAFANG